MGDAVTRPNFRMGITNLNAMRDAAHKARTQFRDLLSTKFPGQQEFHWYRAMAAVKNENCRRNDDITHDAAMAADTEIKAAHAEYIRLLHVFYKARDGEYGVLGGRGI